MMKLSLAKLRRAGQMPLSYRNWMVALLNRLGPRVRDRRVTYRLRSGAALCVQGGSHDVRVVNEVWLDRIYEPSPDFTIRRGWTVLDLGAHKGTFAVRAASTGPSTRVHVVEPEPENLEYLKTNLTLNRLANVVVHAGAISTEHGEGLLYLGGHRGSGTNSLFRDRVEGENMQAVAVRTFRLEELLDGAAGSVDLMKMDVEGAEYSVLHAVSPEALRRIRRIVLEYHAVDGLEEGSVGEDLRKYLQGSGFECTLAPDRPLLFARRPD